MPRVLSPLRSLPHALFLCAAACGGITATTTGEAEDGIPASEGPSARSGPDDGPSVTSSGTATGDIRVVAVVHAELEESSPPNASAVVIEVDVAAQGQPVSNATVLTGAVGRAVPATASRRGHYVVTQVGFAPWYELSVESPSGSLRGVRLRAPAPHKVNVAGRSARSGGGIVRWTPSRENSVDDVGVRVVAGDGQQVTFASGPLADAGESMLPESAFVGTTPHLVEVRRAASLSLAAPSSVAFVELVSKHQVKAQ